jgi:hypothetical protein
MAYTTIDNPELYFQAKIYTGNGSDDHAITFDNTDTSMQADMIWFKSRSNSGYNHCIVDSVRGVTKIIRPNTNGLEGTYSDALKSFDSNGFTLDDDSNGEMNKNTYTQVAWCWKESATSGFDITTATGTGSAKTISHSLSAVPHWMISKEKSGSVNDWTVYHHKNTSSPQTDSLILNETNTTSDQDTHWNDTVPTSSVFTVGSGSVVNRDGSTYVYYLWSEKQGFSKFGTYTGTGNADGPFIHLGFRPAFVMIRRTNSAKDWYIFDNKVNPINPTAHYLEPNTSDAQGNYAWIDFVSNGFKIRNTSDGASGSGDTYVYFAFAEAPFVNSNGVPGNAR